MQRWALSGHVNNLLVKSILFVIRILIFVFVSFLFFFFNDTATTEIYTLSLHDALPILYSYNDKVIGHRSKHTLTGLPARYVCRNQNRSGLGLELVQST